MLLLASGVAALLPKRAEARVWPLPRRRPVLASYQIGVGDATIQVDFGPGHATAGVKSLLSWVERAARTVTVYYGQFPVSHYRVRVEMVPGASGVLGGATQNDAGRFPALTDIRVGEGVTDGELVADGIMTREMVKTAFPTQPKSHTWIEEGLALYVEPVARAQAGLLKPEAVWAGMVREMPQGDPQPGDKGLDRAHTEERIRWGGAQFCLLADVTIRGQTRNRKGLQDALRAIVNGGGTIAAHWPLEKTFETGDLATGTEVLMAQYRRMGRESMQVDLGGLWRELGVEPVAGSDARFNNLAPLASTRRAILTPNDKTNGRDLRQSAGVSTVKHSTSHPDLAHPLRGLKQLLRPHKPSGNE